MNDKAAEFRNAIMAHGGEETHLFREIMRAHQAIMSVFSREVGMPASRLSLLRLLAVSHPEEPGIIEIARRLSIDAAAVTRQVKELEAGKFVSRRADPRDKRRTCIRLTARGQRSFRALHERAHGFEKELGSRMTSGEIGTAVKVLAAVHAALESRL